jgi:hypothetical protein
MRRSEPPKMRSEFGPGTEIVHAASVRCSARERLIRLEGFGPCPHLVGSTDGESNDKKVEEPCTAEGRSSEEGPQSWNLSKPKS